MIKLSFGRGASWQKIQDDKHIKENRDAEINNDDKGGNK